MDNGVLAGSSTSLLEDFRKIPIQGANQDLTLHPSKSMHNRITQLTFSLRALAHPRLTYFGGFSPSLNSPNLGEEK